MSATYTGGSIGGGGEFAFTPNVIGRVEYLYDDYRMSSSAVVLHDYTAKLQNASTVRGALSIKLN
jgi:opacity protein-like surface antigen